MALTKLNKNSQILINNTTGSVNVSDFNDDQLVVNVVDNSLSYKAIQNTSKSVDTLYFQAGSIDNSGIIYKQLSNVTVANTTTETSLLASTVTIPANTINLDDTFRVRASGIIADTGTPSTTLNLKVGSVTLVTSTATLPTISGTAHFDFWFEFNIRSIGSTGTVIGQGATLIKDATTVSAGYNRGLIMSTTATIDTTVDNTINATYTWGTASASNTITCTNLTIEKL